jgi:hypothetical protein
LQIILIEGAKKMWKTTLKIMNAHKLAEKVRSIKNADDEIKFATCFDVDEDGAVLESSTGDWWGAKFMGAFDGTFLLFGAFGGKDWYVYDADSGMVAEEMQAVIEEIFRRISAEKVCVEVAEWV